MQRRFDSWIWSFCVLACLPSTFPPAFGQDTVPRIIDGVAVPESSFPSVGHVKIVENLGNFQEVSQSTGTLIAPGFVLTAAHSVRSTIFGKLFTDPRNITFTIGGTDYAVTSYFVHPTEQNGIVINHEGFLDLSILQLAQPVTTIAPSSILRHPPAQGSELILAGFGLIGSGAKGFNPRNEMFPPAGTIETGQAPLEILTPTLIQWNFKPVPPPNNESNTAPGDSGGPAFIAFNGINVVVGVTSGGTNPTSAFGDQPFDTRVDIATDWIDSIVNGRPDFTSFPTAVPPSAAPNQSVAFTAAAGSASISWDFGDGTTSPAGDGSAMHSFAAAGTYLVAATALTTNGNTSVETLTIAIGAFGPHAAGDSVAGTKLTRKQFSIPSPAGIDSKKSPNSSVALTFVHPDFAASFLDFNKAAIRILVGNQELISLNYNVDFFQGIKLKVDEKKGAIIFTNKLPSAGPVIADALGSLNGAASVEIPIILSVNGVLYPGLYPFAVVEKGTRVTGK